MSTDNQFGTFVRTTRKALGLNLRAFCRRNGFDPGNISRLERGISPPPQAQQMLEALAKALKLKPGTYRWEQFIKLATVSQLPTFFRQLRNFLGASWGIAVASLRADLKVGPSIRQCHPTMPSDNAATLS